MASLKTADHICGDALHYVAESELVCLFAHLGVIDNLQQQLSNLLAQVIDVVARNCVGYLVGFFDGVRHNGREILLDIPWVAGLRLTQDDDDSDRERKYL